MSRRTAKLANTLLATIAPLHDLVQAIPNMPIPVRKTLLTVCRIQPDLAKKNRARDRLLRHMTSYFPTPQLATRQTNLDILLNPCSEYIQLPFYAGLVGMFCRNQMFKDKEEIEQLLQESVDKELLAAQETHTSEHLDWKSILSPSKSYRSNNPLISNTSFDGNLNNRIFERLSATKSTLSRMTIFPDYSNKTIGTRAQREMQIINEALKEDFPPTVAGLESLYHRYGIQLDSPTEVRTAFKFGDIRPRVYYARGPAQYYSSRYIQDIFNVLVDALPTTNRYQRFLVSSIRLSIEDMLFIYDFSSFTSTLHEVRQFTEELAQFFEGTSVTVVDSRVGPSRVELSELLRWYNDTCNINPSFDVSDIFGSGREEDLVHNCGMLGVPGNISSCTLLHGIFLMVILMSETCRVVGDDAIGAGPKGEKEQIVDLLAIIGVISASKAETWVRDDDDDELTAEDNRWHYTKRPIERLDDQILFVDQSVIWPALGALHPIFGDAYHTIHYPEDEKTLHRRIANSMLSFVRQFQDFHIEGEEAHLADRFMHLVYEATGMVERSSTGEKTWKTPYILPHSVEEGMHPSLIIERMWNQAVTLPRFEKMYPGEKVFEQDFEVNGSRALRLARDLGYAYTDPIFYTFRVSDNPQYLESFLRREQRFPVLRAYLVKHIPTFLVDMIFPVDLSQPDHDVYLVGSDGEEDEVNML